MSSHRILHLTLKREWFEMIESGKKLEEYRKIKPYWSKKIGEIGRYNIVRFRHGYAKNARTMDFELKEILIGLGAQAWGAPKSERVYILKLGRRLDTAQSKEEQ